MQASEGEPRFPRQARRISGRFHRCRPDPQECTFTDSDADQDRTGIDEEKAAALLVEKLDIVGNMFNGHDYNASSTGPPLGQANWDISRTQTIVGDVSHRGEGRG
jgi:hypothetical protein